MLLMQIKQSDFMTATSDSYKFQEPSVQLLFLGTYFGSKERHNRVQKAEVVATLCEETKRTLTKGCKKFLGLPYGWGKKSGSQQKPATCGQATMCLGRKECLKTGSKDLKQKRQEMSTNAEEKDILEERGQYKITSNSTKKAGYKWPSSTRSAL